MNTRLREMPVGRFTDRFAQSPFLSGFEIELLANFAGTAWSAVVQLICVPLYLKLLGIEGYGLIGFYLMFQAVAQVLDLGVSPTMNRELARYSVQPEKAAEARDLVRTLETGYWLMGFVIGSVLICSSSWIARSWIRSSSLPTHSVRQALLLMGALVFFQWPVSFYQGGLMGLRRQMLFNCLKIGVVTFNNLGAVLILWLVSPTIQAFLSWQIVVSSAQAVLLAVLLWKCLPSSARASRFDFSLLRGVGGFAAGMSGIALTTLILTQIDKLVVSKLLSLKVFGYYTLAWTMANGLSLVSGAVFNVIFPRMSALVATSNESGLRRSYHTASQLMATLVLPMAAVFLFFPTEVIRLWTGSVPTAAFSAPILRVLTIGSAMNALYFVPYCLQLAAGWTKLSVYATLSLVLAVTPLTVFSTEQLGAAGAASIWAVMNIVNLVVVVLVMHRRLLPLEAGGYFADIGMPLLSIVGVGALGRILIPTLASRHTTLFALVLVWGSTLVSAVLTAPRIRAWALTRLTAERASCA